MPEPRHLTHAPIQEAVVEFRVPPREDFDPERFEEIWPEIDDEYPLVQRRMQIRGTFRLGDDGLEEEEGRVPQFIGFRRQSEDQRWVVQFLSSVFTYSRLEPYTDWDELFSRAWPLWERYCAVAAPDRVVRAGVRFINRMSFRLPAELDEYFQWSVPTGGPLEGFDLEDFLIRKTVSKDDVSVRIHFASVEDPKPDHGAVILDIDAFKTGDFEPLSEELRETFGELREVKNGMFFETLTNKALEAFE